MRCPIKCCLQSKEIDQGTIAKGLCDIVGQDQVKACVRAAKVEAEAEATMSVDALREKIEAICRFLKMPEARMATVLQQLATQSQPQHVNYLRHLQEAQAKQLRVWEAQAKEQLRVWEAQQRYAVNPAILRVNTRTDLEEHVGNTG